MTLWDGNLRNTQTDIVIDNVILAVMILVYLVQMNQIFEVGSTHGISAYFLLFNALFSNHQCANMHLLTVYAWPTDRSPLWKLIGRGGLRGAQAVGATRGVMQVVIHWMYSSMLLAVSLAYPLNGIESYGIFASSTSITVIWVVHTALFLVTAIYPTLPESDRSFREMDTDMLVGISGYVNTWMSLVFVILQFYPQLLECRSMSGSPGSLSLLSLGLRAVVMLAVAVRWLQRLGPPKFAKGDGRPPLAQWYRWGWLPFNYIIEGIGCALLVGMYLQAGWMGATSNIAGDETPVVA